MQPVFFCILRYMEYSLDFMRHLTSEEDMDRKFEKLEHSL